jgi:hypothetical protein
MQTKCSYLAKRQRWLVPEMPTLSDAKEVGNQLSLFRFCYEKYPERPSWCKLATWTKISTKYARKILIELTNTGSLTNPEVTNSERVREKEKLLYLDPAEELFLLALRAEIPAWANTGHVAQLYTYHGTLVLTSFVLELFKRRFHFTTGLFESQILFLLTSFGKKTSSGL